MLHLQSSWSNNTFGPGLRTKGITNHIRQELEEIEADPENVEEWVDVMILAFDGARRAGVGPYDVMTTYIAKVKKNIERTWPDWRVPGTQDTTFNHIEESNE